MEVKLTYRGWPGHFIMSHACVFHLNTLVECGSTRIIVNTVGNMQLPGEKTVAEIGLDRYYETMAFKAALKDGYWDQESGQEIPLNCITQVCHVGITADQEAQDMHLGAIAEIIGKIFRGEIK